MYYSVAATLTLVDVRSLSIIKLHPTALIFIESLP
jgi:hypothetical protein